jgi:hypothetical protein
MVVFDAEAKKRVVFDAGWVVFDGMAIFQEKTIPDGGRLAGWSWFVETFGVRAPVRRPSCVSELHISGSRRDDREWSVFDRRYWTGDDFEEQLNFAMRHENVDPLVMKRVFDAVPKRKIEAYVRAAPTGTSVRRAWFLYETLTGRRLNVRDAPKMVAVDALDPEAYVTTAPRVSTRHRVRDNLLGSGRFWPVIRRTKALTEAIELDLSAKARETIARTGAHLVARAASFLLLADSRASFVIEGELPPRTRLDRWGRAILEAGKNPLTLDEMLRLQRILIEDTRFVHPGLRPDGVFLGERDREGEPLPEFIGARPEDLQGLLEGLLEANDRMRQDGVDAVLKAAATAFGFVYIHPFQDGNGRMHRCLIHHVLAERRFAPPGMVFPVSSVMLDRIDEYRTTLQGHSAPLMPFIEWKPTTQKNVEVLNDTADLYRYFDCTAEAEFLYSCVRRTVDEDLPREIDYLRRHDEAIRRIMDTVEMPDRLAENLLLYIRQNHGVLSKKRREGEFKQLRPKEVTAIERIVRETFEGF